MIGNFEKIPFKDISWKCKIQVQINSLDYLLASAGFMLLCGPCELMYCIHMLTYTNAWQTHTLVYICRHVCESIKMLHYGMCFYAASFASS